MALDTEPGVFDAVIAANQSVSAGVDLGTERLHRIEMPAAWDAASITLLTKSAAGVWGPVYLDTAEYVVTATGALRHIVLNPSVTYGLQHVQVRSGVTGAAVNQTEERTLKLVCA